MDLNEDKIEGSFWEQELQKTKQKVFRIDNTLPPDYKKK